MASYIDCIRHVGENDLDANVSIKLTQLGMGFDDDVASKNLDLIASEALAVGTTVTVDMEEAAHTETTISAVRTGPGGSWKSWNSCSGVSSPIGG